MYSVSSELYHEAAARLSDAIDGGNYFSGSLAFRFGDTDCRLTAAFRCPKGYGTPLRISCLSGGNSTPRKPGVKCSTTSISPS